MRKILLTTIALLLFGSGAFAQGVRVPLTVTQSGTVGTSSNVVVLPSNPVVKFCNFPASGSPCANLATTYTDGTLTTPCSTSTQFVLDGTTSCVANFDVQNNGGVWVAPGKYAYTITIGTSNYGPFFVTAGCVSARHFTARQFVSWIIGPWHDARHALPRSLYLHGLRHRHAQLFPHPWLCARLDGTSVQQHDSSDLHAWRDCRCLFVRHRTHNCFLRGD
jgi:hypothetical protein